MPSLVHSLYQGVQKNALFSPGDSLLVAVSGGADSIFLLYFLRQLNVQYGWNLNLSVGHVNHKVRGPSGDADAAFVEAVARRWNLPCRVTSLSHPSLGQAGVNILNKNWFSIRRSPSPQPSPQEGEGDYQKSKAFGYIPPGEGLPPKPSEGALRKKRYQALRSMAFQSGASRVAMAHHLDDHLETILLQILRGGGATGLKGIVPKQPFMPFVPTSRSRAKDILNKNWFSIWRSPSPQPSPQEGEGDHRKSKSFGYKLSSLSAPSSENSLFLVRPLLSISKEEIRSELQRCHLSYRTDPTNADPDYALRNRLRQTWLPLLKTLVPSLGADLLSLASESQHLQQLLETFHLSTLSRLTPTEEGTYSIPLSELAHGSRLYLKTFFETFFQNKLGQFYPLTQAHTQRIYRFFAQPIPRHTLPLGKNTFLTLTSTHAILVHKPELYPTKMSFQFGEAPHPARGGCSTQPSPQKGEGDY